MPEAPNAATHHSDVPQVTNYQQPHKGGGEELAAEQPGGKDAALESPATAVAIEQPPEQVHGYLVVVDSVVEVAGYLDGIDFNFGELGPIVNQIIFIWREPDVRQKVLKTIDLLRMFANATGNTFDDKVAQVIETVLQGDILDWLVRFVDRQLHSAKALHEYEDKPDEQFVALQYRADDIDWNLAWDVILLIVSIIKSRS